MLTGAAVLVGVASGCSFSTRQLVPGSEIAGNWAFSGAQTVVRGPEVGGERGSVPITAPARGGQIRDQAAYASVGFGLDTDIARLQIATASTRSPLSWFGVEAWYKHALGKNRLGALHALAGIGWQALTVTARTNGRLQLGTPVAVGGGRFLRDGDAFTYEAESSRDSWLIGLGVQQTLWTDWLYAFASVQLAISRESRQREALRIALRREDGSALETLDIFQDDRFDRTVQQAGRVRTGIEAPFVQVALGLGAALPPFRIIAGSGKTPAAGSVDGPAKDGRLDQRRRSDYAAKPSAGALPGAATLPSGTGALP